MSAPDLNAAARELCALTISGSDAPDLAARFREHWDNGGFPAEQRTEWERRALAVLDAAYPATREAARPWTPATSELAQRLRATEPPAEDDPPPRCGYCGGIAQGFAAINDIRYCHPDEGQDCYTLARQGHWQPGPVDPTDPRAPEHREDD